MSAIAAKELKPEAIGLEAFDSPSVDAVCAGDRGTRELISQLLGIAVRGLREMYRSESQCFAFTRRRYADNTLMLEGESARYGAITQLGLSRLPEAGQRLVLHGETAAAFGARLVDEIETMTNVGDVALVTWAAAETEHADLERAVARLLAVDPGGPCETVIAAWVVSALTAVAERSDLDVNDALRTGVKRLLRCYRSAAKLFPHYTDRSIAPRGRGHVSCFADQVYPIQALARYGGRRGDELSMRAAEDCAAAICALMGSAGQWWWHYDVRQGTVLEGYPVYSVHQDSMAPMALLDLADAGGTVHADAVRLGLSWMEEAPEIRRSLMDEEHAVIWRKVGRTDPRKLVRVLRAAVSRVSPRWRLRALDRVFPAARVDEECRPYHLGWILYAWIRGDG